MSPAIKLKKWPESLMILRAAMENYNPFANVLLSYIAYRLDKKSTTKKGKTALLYAHTEGALAADLLVTSTQSHIYLTESLLQRELRVFDYAQASDLEDVLRDDSFQNMILFGHGYPNVWIATDRPVYLEELDSIPFERKTGEVIKLSCGNGIDNFALRIAADPNNAYFFEQKASQGQFLQYLRQRLYQAISQKLKSS